MRFSLLVAVPILFSMPAFSADDPRPDMQVMASEVANIEKYLLTEADFSNPANEAAITKSMNAVAGHLEHLDKGTFAEKPALKVNLGLLREHLDESRKSFTEGNKGFSRVMMQSSLQLCIACHTRAKSLDMHLPEMDLSKAKPEERAEFFFATRQFDKGRAEYEKIVDGFPGNKAGMPGLHKALIGLAVYFARVKEDPKGGEEFFRKTADKKDIPFYVKEQSSAWAKEFQDWARESKKEDPAKLTETQLVARAKKLLRADDFSLISGGDRSFHVKRLRASSLLHRALEAPGATSPSKGEALYYLGQIYQRIDTSMFFRFGEMYLKACIREYPKTATARSCYVSLEQAVTEGYTGSAGTDIPEDEQVELMKLKRKAY